MAIKTKGEVMIKQKVTLDETIKFLNELKDIDNKALCRLVNLRVFCNKDILNHPTVQCTAIKNDPDNSGIVGFLGVLNGLFGIDEETGWGVINFAGEYDDKVEEIPRPFTKILKVFKTDFERIKNKQPQVPIKQEIK